MCRDQLRTSSSIPTSFWDILPRLCYSVSTPQFSEPLLVGDVTAFRVCARVCASNIRALHTYITHNGLGDAVENSTPAARSVQSNPNSAIHRNLDILFSSGLGPNIVLTPPTWQHLRGSQNVEKSINIVRRASHRDLTPSSGIH